MFTMLLARKDTTVFLQSKLVIPLNVKVSYISNSIFEGWNYLEVELFPGFFKIEGSK